MSKRYSTLSMGSPFFWGRARLSLIMHDVQYHGYWIANVKHSWSYSHPFLCRDMLLSAINMLNLVAICLCSFFFFSWSVWFWALRPHMFDWHVENLLKMPNGVISLWHEEGKKGHRRGVRGLCCTEVINPTELVFKFWTFTNFGCL